MAHDLKGLRTTVYKVPDLDKAKEWYTNVLGFPPYFDEPFYVGFNVCGYELGLLPYEGDVTTGDSVYSYWGVDNINGKYQQLLDFGATELEKPTNVGGELMVAAVKDPWGNPFGIIYNPYFKSED